MRIIDLFSFLLTPVCVRFPVAMPPVWLRWSTLNRCGVNQFGFDYPLGCSWFLCLYLSGLGLLSLRSASGRCRSCRGLRWGSVGGVGECSQSLSDVGFRSDGQSELPVAGHWVLCGTKVLCAPAEQRLPEARHG